MVYRSPYRASILPSTAHLDDALKDFIVKALDTLRQRGITDVLAGTEIECSVDRKDFQNEEFAHLRQRIASHISEVAANRDFDWLGENAAKLNALGSFRDKDLLMARIHEMSPLRQFLLPNFGWDYEDNPRVNEFRLKPMGLGRLQDAHHAIIRAVTHQAHRYDFDAKIETRHLSFSAWDEEGNIAHPDHSEYKQLWSKATALQVKSLYDSVIFYKNVDELLRNQNFSIGCVASRTSPMRSLAGRNEFRLRRDEIQADHLNLIIGLMVVVPLLAASDPEINIAGVASPTFHKRGIFTVPDEEAQRANNHTLSVLSGGTVSPAEDRPNLYALIIPAAYIKSVSHLLSEELKIGDANRLQEFFKKTYIQKTDVGYEIIWSDDPRTLNQGIHKILESQCPNLSQSLQQRQGITLEKIVELCHVEGGYKYGDGIKSDLKRSETGAAYAERFAKSELFEKILPPELFAALVEAAYKTPEQFLECDRSKGNKR